MKDSKIFTDELKRTIPIYILGMFFHSITVYIHCKIPSILGNILDLLLQGEIQKQIIIAHRKSTIANSDEVIYLKDGQIDMILESL